MHFEDTSWDVSSGLAISATRALKRVLCPHVERTLGFAEVASRQDMSHAFACSLGAGYKVGVDCHLLRNSFLFLL